MSQSPLADDIAFVRQLAEEGASAPTLGGRFSVWWGALVAIALSCHWAAISGHLPIAPNMIGLIWIIMAIVGVGGTYLLGKTLGDKPGLSAPGNRAEGTIWPVATAGIFIYAIAIGFAVGLRDQPVLLFNTILPLAFILHAVGAAVAAALFRRTTRWMTVGLSLILAGVMAFFIDRPEIYLIAAVGIIFTQVIPGLSDLRAEPKTVV